MWFCDLVLFKSGLSTTQDTQIGTEYKSDAFKNKIYFNVNHACSLVIKPSLVFDNTTANERGQTNIFGKQFWSFPPLIN